MIPAPAPTAPPTVVVAPVPPPKRDFASCVECAWGLLLEAKDEPNEQRAQRLFVVAREMRLLAEMLKGG